MRMALGLAVAGLAVAEQALAAPVRAQSDDGILGYVGECVPFARQASGIRLQGDSWTWWASAEGRYRRGHTPAVGAVLVFARTHRLPLGHLAVVSRVIDERVVMVTHANWSRIAGERGHVERDVTLFDVSHAGDWSQVKVWYHDNRGLGGSSYPIYGFIYGTPDRESDAPPAHPAPQLSEKQPDYVGALIDAYGH